MAPYLEDKTAVNGAVNAVTSTIEDLKLKVKGDTIDTVRVLFVVII
jgi:hypothetical protein